jgi:hypothetical protein
MGGLMLMINQVRELKKCYPHVNEPILKLSDSILHDMNLGESNKYRVMQLLAFACDKHYQMGYNSKK